MMCLRRREFSHLVVASSLLIAGGTVSAAPVWVSLAQPLGGQTGAALMIEPSTPVARLDEPHWKTRHEQKLVEARSHKVDVLYLGDSITQRWESGPYRAVWDYYNKGRNALDLGFNGDTTGNVLWRITAGGELQGLDPRAVVMLIGTNNTAGNRTWTADQTVDAIVRIVHELHTRLPHATVILLSILPADQGKRKDMLDDAINSALARRYSSGSDSHVKYLDVTGIFLRDGAIRTCLYADPQNTPPGTAIHPTPTGQALIAAALEPVLARVLGQTPRIPLQLPDPDCP